MNKLIDAVKNNKDVIIRRGLVVLGSFAGLALAGAIAKNGDTLIVDGDVEIETVIEVVDPDAQN